jgi:hypothetical protein
MFHSNISPTSSGLRNELSKEHNQAASSGFDPEDGSDLSSEMWGILQTTRHKTQETELPISNEISEVGANTCIEGEMRREDTRELTGTKNKIDGITELQRNWKERAEKKTTESLTQPAYNYDPMGRQT